MVGPGISSRLVSRLHRDTGVTRHTRSGADTVTGCLATVVDVGPGGALLGVDVAALQADRTRRGQLLESFVFLELRRQANRWEDGPNVYHFRDNDGAEVDIVLERVGGGLP